MNVCYPQSVHIKTTQKLVFEILDNLLQSEKKTIIKCQYTTEYTNYFYVNNNFVILQF